MRKHFDKASGTGNDKKTILDQAFRDVLLSEHVIGNTANVEALITLSIAACRQDISTPTIPVVLMSDVFDTVTLDQCERLFSYVESNVSVWKESWFFAACKNNLLRMCNDLLKRFSRAQNTVFCGRILLFLATFFPFSERSGLNIISEFNLENLTQFDDDAKDEVLDSVQSENIQVKIDYNLYSKFWALQDFYCNPNQCYDPSSWKKFSSVSCINVVFFPFFSIEMNYFGFYLFFQFSSTLQAYCRHSVVSNWKSKEAQPHQPAKMTAPQSMIKLMIHNISLPSF